MAKITVRYENRANSRRRQHKERRFVTDDGWKLIQRFFPSPPASGRPWKWDLRLIFEAVLHLLRTGCQWRHLPQQFPPFSTVQRHFYRWRDAGLIERINHFLVMADREREGREASPTASVIDSQTVKTTTTGGIKKYDGGKKLNGMKRHIHVDTDGRLLMACVSPGDMHDSRAGALLLMASRQIWPFLEMVFADSAYRGDHVGKATPIKVVVVTGPPNQKGFIVQKRRWVVERTISWINVNRRMAKDYERDAATSLVMVYLASVLVLLQRI